ncbi:hypothetical protein P3T16_005526 [Paraburkholderia sp. GAS42]
MQEFAVQLKSFRYVSRAFECIHDALIARINAVSSFLVEKIHVHATGEAPILYSGIRYERILQASELPVTTTNGCDT